MKIKKTKFKNLLIVKQKNNKDNRGNLRETFNYKILKKKFIFEYCTTSKKNVFRGFHFQYKKQQSKLISVIKGEILDCVIDLRKNSKTFGKTFKIILSENKNISLYIPKGFAHGYLTLKKENIVICKQSNFFSSKFEDGIIWNDKTLKIKLPTKKPLLSIKDKNQKSFINFIEKYKYL